MLYREIIAVCSQIHTKHINTLCGQNVELLNVKLVVQIVTSGALKGSTTHRAICSSKFRSLFLFVASRFSCLLTHCRGVTQICVFNTLKLGTSASSP